MRHLLRGLAVGCLACWGLAAAALADGKAKDESSTCKTYGTSVHFEQTPSDAAKRALKEEKLVVVLHISGIFEDPTLT